MIVLPSTYEHKQTGGISKAALKQAREDGAFELATATGFNPDMMALRLKDIDRTVIEGATLLVNDPDYRPARKHMVRPGCLMTNASPKSTCDPIRSGYVDPELQAQADWVRSHPNGR